MDCGTLLPRYYPLPQFLLDLNISSTSKILYVLLLNRANLSQKNALNELSKQGLLERVRAEFGRANHLYIKIPKDVETVGKPPGIASGKRPSIGHKSASEKARYPTTNNYTKSPNYYTRLITEMDYSFKEGESL